MLRLSKLYKFIDRRQIQARQQSPAASYPPRHLLNSVPIVSIIDMALHLADPVCQYQLRFNHQYRSQGRRITGAIRHVLALFNKTMPSSFSLHACLKIIGPSPSICSTNRSPPILCASSCSNLPLRTSKGRERRSMHLLWTALGSPRRHRATACRSAASLVDCCGCGE
jgi:hypothetical protein